MKAVQRPYEKSIFRAVRAAIVVPVIVGFLGLSAVSLLVSKSEGLLDQLELKSDQLLLQDKTFASFVFYCCSLLSGCFEPDKSTFFAEKAHRQRVLLDRNLSALTPTEAANFSKRVESADALSKAIGGQHFEGNINRFSSLSNLIKDEQQMSSLTEGDLIKLHAVLTSELSELHKLADTRFLVLRSALILSFACSLLCVIFYGVVVFKGLKGLSEQESKQASRSATDELDYLRQCLASASAELLAIQEQRAFFVQMVAHDLRSPLMAATASLQEFEDVAGDFLSVADLKESESAQKDLSAAFELTSKFLAFEKVQADQLNFQRQAVDLEALLDAVISENVQIVKKRKHFIVNDCARLEIFCDPKLIKIVLSHWLSWLIEKSPVQSRTKCSALQSGGLLTVELACSGVSGAATRMQNFFDLLPGSDNGSPLLESFFFDLSKKIIETHGGSVGAKFAADTGAVLWFSVPTSRAVSEVKSKPKERLELNAFHATSSIFRSRLLTVGLAVAVIPLILQFGAFRYLSRAMGELSQFEGRFATHVEVSTAIQMLWLKIFEANSNAAFFVASGSQKFKENAESAIVQFDKIANQKFDTPGEPNRVWREISNYASFQSAQVKGYLSDESVTSNRLLGTISSSIRSADNSCTVLQEAVTKESRLLKESKLQLEKSSNNTLLLLLLVGVLDAFAGSLALVLLQSRFQSRLRHVVANARKITEKEPLSSSLIGGDELAVIDARLHETRAQLNEAEAERNATVTVISEAIFLPLQTADRRIDSLWTAAVDQPENRGRSAERVQMHLNAAKKNCKRLAALCVDLLSVAGSASTLALNLKPVKLNSLIADVLDSLRSLAAARDVQLSAEIAETSNMQLKLDELRMHQVLTNLISNAIKFAPPSSTVLVGSVARSEPPSVQIDISDQGKGIDPDVIESIFRKFSTGNADEHTKGFGIGLAVCKLIVESHGGNIAARNSDSGAVFSIVLPVVEEPSEKSTSGLTPI